MKDSVINNCEIVRDLLPMYADGCTSEATKKTIHSHLENCEECKKYLAGIKKCKAKVFSSEIPESSPDYTDLIKKIKHRRVIRHTLFSVLVVTLVAGNIVLAITRGE